MRINKYLADNNVASRREADKLIAQGKIYVNGKKAELGQQVDEGDVVEVRSFSKKYLYFAFHKPRGIVTHSAQEGEQEIFDIFDTKGEKLFPVGRLDKDSEGLIILTNDGRLTKRLLDPKNKCEKEYVVTVDKKYDEEFLNEMSKGVTLDNGYTTKPCKTEKVTDDMFKITLTEGKNRQIRRMTQSLGYEVTRLKRIRIASIELRALAPGKGLAINGSMRQKFLAPFGL
jgi:23S rRNA pseudouridine2604 synthase